MTDLSRRDRNHDDPQKSLSTLPIFLSFEITPLLMTSESLVCEITGVTVAGTGFCPNVFGNHPYDPCLYSGNNGLVSQGTIFSRAA